MTKRILFFACIAIPAMLASISLATGCCRLLLEDRLLVCAPASPPPPPPLVALENMREDELLIEANRPDVLARNLSDVCCGWARDTDAGDVEVSDGFEWATLLIC